MLLRRFAVLFLFVAFSSIVLAQEFTLEEENFKKFVATVDLAKEDQKKFQDNFTIQHKKNLQEIDTVLRVVHKLINDSVAAGEKHREQFLTVDQLWLDTLTQTLALSSKNRQALSLLPALPSIPETIHSENSVKEAEAKISELKQNEVVIRNFVRARHEDERLKQAELQKIINDARAEVFAKAPLNIIMNRFFKGEFWYSLWMELLASPHRILSFVERNMLYTKDRLLQGTKGIREIVFKLIFVLLGIGGLFLVNFTLHYLRDKADSFLRHLLASSSSNRVLIKFSNIWQKIKSFSTDIVWFALLSLPMSSEFSFVLSVARIVFAYRIIVGFFILTFSAVSEISFSNIGVFRSRAEQSSKLIGKLFLIYSLSMLLVEGALGRVYLYTLISLVTLVVLVVFVFIITRQWEGELLSYLEKRVSGVLVEKIVLAAKYIPSFIRPFYYFTALVFGGVLHFVSSATENLEISKKISAKIFKKQIESVESDDDQLKKVPEDYLARFKLQSLDNEADYITPYEQLPEAIMADMLDWLNEKSDEHTLVVFGDKGIGKTTLINHMLQEHKKKSEVECQYITYKMTSKVTTRDKLKQVIYDIFSVEEKSETFDLYKIDSALDKPTYVFIDEAQNIFLSEVDGFDGYNYLVNLVNFSTKNIFWILSFNKYSWLYLERAFGRRQFFRNIFELKGWSDEKIKEMILKRHSATSYRLSYDLLISATKSDDEVDRFASVEAKFFKLLWELSSGNPRASLYLWSSALSIKRSSTFQVNVPRLRKSLNLTNYGDDILFVLANVLKHENLSAKEIESTTNLPYGVTRNAIKVALEQELFYRDDYGRYMIDLTAQQTIMKFLRAKNFIYGN